MDKTIATEDQVYGRHLVPSDVEQAKLDPEPAVSPFIGGDHIRHDIRTDIVNTTQVNVLHPVEVTTGNIKYALDAEFRNEKRESRSNDFCLL